MVVAQSLRHESKVCVNGSACGTEREIWGTERELGILLLVYALLGLYLVLISYALVLRWVCFFNHWLWYCWL